MPRAENFGDLTTADHKVLSEQQSSICRGGARFGNPVVTILLRAKQNFPGDPEEPNEVPGADEETKSHLH